MGSGGLGATSLVSMMLDSVTIEPYTGRDYQQAPTYGAAVTYQAQVLPYSRQMKDAQGREFVSMAQVIISGRQQIDLRSRVTLPAGWQPNQPPIRILRPLAGLGLDHTEVIL
jgi:hypothetical protein